MENSSFTTEEITEGLFRFIDNSPTAFHAVQNAARMLEEAGYKKIVCETAAGIRAGGRYYATRNDSALIAFRIPAGEMKGLRIAASHSDSPCFKVKETPEGCGRPLCKAEYGRLRRHDHVHLAGPSSICGRQGDSYGKRQAGYEACEY